MHIGFIGAGKMATAMACGLVEKHVVAPREILAADVLPEAAAAFAKRTGATIVADGAAVVAGADVVVLAVKPQYAAAALEPLKGMFADVLLVSIAAGLPLAKLAAWTGAARVVRVMPNTPAMVDCGAAAFACAPGATPEDADTVRRVFGAVGVAVEVEESQMDAVTALSGSGPAYVFEMIQAMVDAAVAQGLPADLARELTVQTVRGAAEMVRRGMGTPDELRIAVTSPGGTTAAGLKVMGDADYRGLIARTVAAACARSRELGRG